MDKINNLTRSNAATAAALLSTPVVGTINSATLVEDIELYELARLSGIQMDAKVFK